ncbi:LmbE-like protein [Xylariaceae sp. FL0662B]|nr:LmbE-like protein [Xylariaceae sp. FL0662B]
MVHITLSSLGILAVVLPLLYIYTAAVAQTRFPALRNKRICLLIAHPDDEAMFFAPTVLALTRPEAGNHVKILCLSSGNADGLGETRKRELVKSGLLLGLRREDDVLVIDNVDFPDSMTTTWDPTKIAALLRTTFAPSHPSGNQRRAAPDTQPPTAAIDALITFDARGVSAHPNHISLYHGARAFASALARGRPGWAPPVDLYTLTSVPVVRKYLGFLDAFVTVAAAAAAPVSRKKSPKGNPGALLSMNALVGGGGGSGRESYATARRAMTEAHQSQMVWFRWGWIALSRYMYVNDLRLERVKT